MRAHCSRWGRGVPGGTLTCSGQLRATGAPKQRSGGLVGERRCGWQHGVGGPAGILERERQPPGTRRRLASPARRRPVAGRGSCRPAAPDRGCRRRTARRTPSAQGRQRVEPPGAARGDPWKARVPVDGASAGLRSPSSACRRVSTTASQQSARRRRRRGRGGRSRGAGQGLSPGVLSADGPTGAPGRGRRRARPRGGRAGPAGPVRRALPGADRRLGGPGAGPAAAAAPAGGPGRAPAGRPAHAGDDRHRAAHRVPRGSTRTRGACCSPPTPTPMPPSGPSTTPGWSTTCSSRGTRRRTGSTRCWTTCSRPGGGRRRRRTCG